jgi:hypothetical protein
VSQVWDRIIYISGQPLVLRIGICGKCGPTVSIGVFAVFLVLKVCFFFLTAVLGMHGKIEQKA